MSDESTAPTDGLPEDGGSNRRTLALLGVAGALVLVGLLAYLFVFSGGQDGATTSALGGPLPAATSSPTRAGTAPAKKSDLVARNFRGAVGRDPFKALITEPVAAATSAGVVPAAPAAPAAPPAAAPLTITLPTLPTLPASPLIVTPTVEPTKQPARSTRAPTATPTKTSSTPPPPTPIPTPTPTKPAPPRGPTIRVVEVSNNNTNAHVTVNRTDYRGVKVGKVFATNFKLLRLEGGRCGTFQYGDEKFDLCEGRHLRM